jgi:hypothetical protein
VQAINDEFLEWFVKNQVVRRWRYHQDVYSMGKWDRRSNIIIQRNKQNLEKDMFELEQELDIPSYFTILSKKRLRSHNPSKSS